MQAMPAHRATADVALLQLAAPAKGKTPAALGMPNIPIIVGSRFTIAGIGVTVRGDGKSGGTIRVAGLVATGKPGTLQIRLVDPVGAGHARRARRLHRRFRRRRCSRTSKAVPPSSASSAGRPGRTARRAAAA